MTEDYCTLNNCYIIILHEPELKTYNSTCIMITTMKISNTKQTFQVEKIYEKLYF